MTDHKTNPERAAESVDEGRRSIVKRLLVGAVLAAPVVQSLVAPAEAYADPCDKGKGKGNGGKGKGGKGKGGKGKGCRP